MGKAPATQVLRFEFESLEPTESGTPKRLEMVAGKSLKAQRPANLVCTEENRRGGFK